MADHPMLPKGSLSPKSRNGKRKWSTSRKSSPSTPKFPDTDLANKSNSGLFSKIGKLFKSSKSSPNSQANNEISKRMHEEEQYKQRSLNILLLGAGGSGKSTIFKQMEKLYNGKIEEKEMESSYINIERNILYDVNNLCKYNILLNSNSTNQEYLFNNSELTEICYRIASWPSNYLINNSGSQLTMELGKELQLLWNDAAFKLTWNKRKNNHIMDNTEYFLNKIIEIIDPSYKVTFEDFVRVRERTAGITSKIFLANSQFGKYRFNITDVGGQRSERRKWMQLFTNIEVVIYVMALSAYDQSLYEDVNKNCLDETLELFYKTCHHQVFNTTDWVVFFNKVDLFEIKIKNIPFTVYKHNFNDLHKHNSLKVKEYIKDQFIQRFYDGGNQQTKKRKGNIYFHATNAINSEYVGRIITKVQCDLIRSSMKKMGCLM